MKEFKDKSAVVTGAGTGIGRALARRCAAEGMRVALADVQPARVESAAAELEDMGAEVLGCVLDVADESAFQAFARQCLDAMGSPDLLFNNAGILRLGQAWSHSEDDWQRLLGINVMGVVNGLNAFVPAMLEAGKPSHIVNTGSVGSLVAAPGMAQYTAAKMAVRGITETLAYDLAAAEAPIGVSLLCPGPVLTSISDGLMGIETGSEERDPGDHLMAGQPGFITADECASRAFEGIRDGRFWIFTHPFNHYLEEKHRAITAGENPEYREVAFDAD